ncbi:YIP1 family protein [Cellvibrio zantedeschiae]|uniref:YIP1 family protein n=1 Tax=Cellvibrio zantedeschiae TaxID=1237077 RepID=A0ABQ3AMS2_9GAMM|nr:Yip1 family protein [Cellvibrio zantedeschiae]GGY62237.1 YIP1 family protein [Cellvibrio zantedeschiae]
MITHVTGLFTHPSQEWKSIRDTQENITHIYLAQVFLLALIPPVSAYVGATKIGWTVGQGSRVVLTESSAMAMAILMYVAMLLGVGVMGAFIQWMSRTYHSSPSYSRCVIFATYTATPLFVAGLTMLYPTPWSIMLFGAAALSYTTYLLYSGVPTFMNISEEEGFMFSSSILTVGLVMLVTLMAFTVLIWSLGFGPIYV